MYLSYLLCLRSFTSKYMEIYHVCNGGIEQRWIQLLNRVLGLDRGRDNNRARESGKGLASE